jgi:hypothetical protein
MERPPRHLQVKLELVLELEPVLELVLEQQLLEER